MDKEKAQGRGQMGLKNGRVIMNTPDQQEQKMGSDCPECGFHSQRAIHPFTGNTFCPRCFEEVGPAYMAA